MPTQQAPSQTPEQNTTSAPADLTVDWLVAGAGAAGMTSAVVAHQLGGDVLLVEKESVYGGTTAKSGGVAWIIANHRQAEVGISDSVDEGYDYLKSLIGDSVDDARIRAFAERSREMLQFMMTHSQVDYSALPVYMDYYDSKPGYKSGGRSMDNAPFNRRRLGSAAEEISIGHYDKIMLPFNVTVTEGRKLQEMTPGSFLLGARLALQFLLDIPARLRGRPDNRLTLGTALVARLRRSLLDRDIPVWLNAPITQLLQEDGRIIGAVVTRNGQPMTIHARRGVMLATGGFSQNAAMRQQYQRAPIGADWTASAPGATGDAVTLGTSVGAALGFMQSAWWSPTYKLPDGRVVALISGKSNPGSIMVNSRGERFTNEAQPYEDFVKAQYAANGEAASTIPCYLLFDANYRRKYAVAHLKPGSLEADKKLPDNTFSSGLVTRADTLAELAAALGMDADTLCRTVEVFNEHARKGEDPAFDRGVSEHDRYYADKTVTPNPSLGPIDEGPFYALRCEPGDLDTKGGLTCDANGQVLDEQGKTIAGLYAAGNASSPAVGDTYPGAGATIGSAMTFGYIAAQHAFDDSSQ